MRVGTLARGEYSSLPCPSLTHRFHTLPTASHLPPPRVLAVHHRQQGHWLRGVVPVRGEGRQVPHGALRRDHRRLHGRARELGHGAHDRDRAAADLRRDRGGPGRVPVVQGAAARRAVRCGVRGVRSPRSAASGVPGAPSVPAPQHPSESGLDTVAPQQPALPASPPSPSPRPTTLHPPLPVHITLCFAPQSGVMTGKCGTQLDHGVLAVGYGTDAGQVRGSGWAGARTRTFARTDGTRTTQTARGSSTLTPTGTSRCRPILGAGLLQGQELVGHVVGRQGERDGWWGWGARARVDAAALVCLRARLWEGRARLPAFFPPRAPTPTSFSPPTRSPGLHPPGPRRQVRHERPVRHPDGPLVPDGVSAPCPVVRGARRRAPVRAQPSV